VGGGYRDGFPLFIYNANGVATQKPFLASPTVTHHGRGTYFGVGIPLNLVSLFKSSKPYAGLASRPRSGSSPPVSRGRLACLSKLVDSTNV